MARTSNVEDVRLINCKSFDQSLEFFKSDASQRTNEIYEVSFVIKKLKKFAHSVDMYKVKYILTYLTQKSTSSANNLKDRGTTSKNRKFSINKQPYRMKNVQMTSDLILRYQLPKRKLEDVLASDLKTLEIFKKANQVNISNRRSLLLFSNIQ